MIKKLKAYLIKRLMAKEVVALKLERLEIKLDSKITYVSISVHTMPAHNRMFSSISVHYADGSVTSLTYDDLQQADREYQFVFDLFTKENAHLRQAPKAKVG
jgi:hypothetical protein